MTPDEPSHNLRNHKGYLLDADRPGEGTSKRPRRVADGTADGPGGEQARRFDDFAHAYSSLADQYGLWTAASVMERGGCTDDGFMDFRTWLVAQGKEVYMAALKDPDSLVDAPDYQDQRFDCLPHMGERAYEELTGRSTY